MIALGITIIEVDANGTMKNTKTKHVEDTITDAIKERIKNIVVWQRSAFWPRDVETCFIYK